MDSDTFQADMNAEEIKIPTMEHFDTVTAATARKTYQNAHAYHINSISINTDGETFISTDDLRVNLWHLDICDQSFSMKLIFSKCPCRNCLFRYR